MNTQDQVKFTPGPWHVGTMNDALFVIDERPRPAPTDTINTSLKTRVIAKLGEPHSEGWSHAECEANARLIAAAPELLNVLQELVLAWSDQPLKGGTLKAMEKATRLCLEVIGEAR